MENNFFKNNKTLISYIIGVLFILFGILIYFNSYLDLFIRPIMQIILMGSSKGKDIIFFIFIGLFIILSNLIFKIANKLQIKLINSNKLKLINSNKLKLINSNKLQIKPNKLLNIIIIFSLIIAIFGLILEIILHNNLGLNSLTTVIVLGNDYTSTSLIHSHIFKSIVGNIIVNIVSIFNGGLTGAINGINNGTLLYYYIPQIANLYLLAIPILFILMLFSLKNRYAFQKIILVFFYSCLIIGSFDGGFFSTPFIIGLIGMILIYFNGDYVEYLLRYFFKKSLKFNINCEIKRNVLSTVKRLMPVIILCIILFLRISIAILGSYSDHYEVDVLDLNENGVNTLLSHYDVDSIQFKDNKTILFIDNINNKNYNEMELLNNLSHDLNGKGKLFSISWNFYSYF